jgi:hypothetical protein
MGQRDHSAGLKQMRERLAWLLAQAEEYDSGRPENATENGITAAHKCAEMAARYRGQADNLAAVIATTKESEA